MAKGGKAWGPGRGERMKGGTDSLLRGIEGKSKECCDVRSRLLSSEGAARPPPLLPGGPSRVRAPRLAIQDID